MINPSTSTKTYWSILKSFLNNKKIPCIPPLFHQNRYITKYKDKTELFNNFFANQCSLIKHSSVLSSVLFKRTENVISSIDFGSDDIAKIIQKLDPNKAHGHDMISIRMLKICDNSIYKPLQLIFRFNNTVVIQSTTHKHLGMILDTKLEFQEHLKDKVSKKSKTIGLLRKLQKILTRPPLLTIYKSFIRPHLDYGDIIYDKGYNISFHQIISSV